MKRLLALTASTTFLAASASSAAAAMITPGYMESIGYSLEYFPAHYSVYVDYASDYDVSPGFEAFVFDDHGGYSSTAQVSVYFQYSVFGISPLEGNVSDLANKTSDCGSMRVGDPLGFGLEGHYSVYFCTEEFFRFDELGGVSEYSIGHFNEIGEIWFASSTPRSVFWGVDVVKNPEVLYGLGVFDSMGWPPLLSAHSVRPGYWQVSAEKWCEDESGYVECRTAAPAPIPLPASVWLLLTGLGALGARGVWDRGRVAA